MDYGHLTKKGATYISEQVLGEKILSELKAKNLRLHDQTAKYFYPNVITYFYCFSNQSHDSLS